MKPIYCDTVAFNLQTQYFVGSLVDFDPKPLDNKLEFFNIMCFGLIGSGKSSFINTLLTSLTNCMQDIQSVGGSEDHVTKHLKLLQINSLPGFPQIRVNLWDTWGLEENTYTGNIFECFLNGLLPAGYEMDNMANKESAITNLENILSADKREVHGLLLFVPHSFLEVTEFIEQVKRNLKIAAASGRNALILVTKSDEIKLEADRVQIHKDVANKLKVPMKNVYMLRNYHDTNQKEFAIDKGAMTILFDILKKSQDFLLSRWKPPKTTASVVSNSHFIVSPPTTTTVHPTTITVNPIASTINPTPVTNPPPYSIQSTSQVNKQVSYKVVYEKKEAMFKANSSKKLKELISTIAKKFGFDADNCTLSDGEATLDEDQRLDELIQNGVDLTFILEVTE